jgi:hypothetical protein
MPEGAADELARILMRELRGEQPASFAYDPRVGLVRPTAGIALDVLGSALQLDTK